MLNNTALNTETLQALFQRLGIVTGNAVAQKVSEALNLAGTDVSELQSRINTIESILDANPDTPEFDVASNIVTQLSNLTQRINNAEDPAVVDSLAYKIAGLTNQLVALSGIVDVVKTSVGLAEDGTITLPDSATDATGVYAYMYGTDGTVAENLLEAVKKIAQNAKEGIVSVSDEVATIKTEIEALQTGISDLSTRTSTLEDDVTGTQADISSLQDRVTDNETAIQNLSATSTDTQTRAASLESAVDSMNAAFNAADALVSAFCAGVNSGLQGTTDAGCTINTGSDNSGL